MDGPFVPDSSLRRNHLPCKPSVQLAGLLFFVLWFASFAGAQNTINTVAGAYSANTFPLLSDIPGPTATVADAQGNFYIAAPFSQYVFQMNSGRTSVSAYVGLGWVGYWGHPNQRLKGLLAEPTGLAIDAQGNLFIADAGNNSVREVSAAGILSTVAGTSHPCPQAKCGDGGPAIGAKLNGPQGVALDAQGNVYIADTGDNRVRCVVMVAGGCGGSAKPVGTITGFAGSLTSCPLPTSPCGDGGPATLANLSGPAGIFVDSSGNVYIADTGDNRIRQVTKHVINTIAGTGNSCFGTAKCGDGGSALAANLGAPHGIWVVSPSLYYIADTRSNRIRGVSSGTISTFAGNGAAGFKGDGGLPTNAKLSAPTGVYADATGNVFISDTGNQRVREVAGSGSGAQINTILGGGNGGDGLGAAKAGVELAQPYAVAVDANNNYYIADTANNRVRVVNTQINSITVANVVVQPGTIQTVAGSGNSGFAKSNNGGSALLATLNGPKGVAVDAAGNIYTATPSDGLVWRVDGTTGVISQFAGDFQPCTGGVPGCGDGGPANQAQLSAPSSLAVDTVGNVYITDPNSNRIREVSNNGTISTVAGTGTAGDGGDDGPATTIALSRPFGVAVDQSGTVYVADSGNNKVRCVVGVAGGCGGSGSPVGNMIRFAYDGKVNFKGDGGWAVNASRWNPTEVAVDFRGNVFVGGGNDDLVQRIDVAPPNVIVTVAGIDTQWWWYAYSGDGGPATKAHIDNSGLAIDGNENLLIADVGNNRIRQVANLIAVGTPAPTTVDFGNVAVGQHSAPMPVSFTNTGANDLVITTIGTSASYAQINSCPASSSSLAPGVSCTILVKFAPIKKGVINGTLTVIDNAFKNQQVVKLTGTGN